MKNASGAGEARRLGDIVQRLAPQWFLVRDVRLPGVMTREEIRRARGAR